MATIKAHFNDLDKKDTGLFCIVADLSDRFTDAISPMKNHDVLAAYTAYFRISRRNRKFADYQTLVQAIVTASRDYRILHPKKTLRGMPVLEWCMLSDALNQSKLGGDSDANLLMSHCNRQSWKNFQSCASEFALATTSADQKQEYVHFRRGAKNLGIKSRKFYRPLHIYRLLSYLVNKTDSGVDGWFDVDKQLRTAFKACLPPFLAAVAACQCSKVPRTRDNFAFLTAVAQDRVGFLQVAAELTKEETTQINTLAFWSSPVCYKHDQERPVISCLREVQKKTERMMTLYFHSRFK